MGARVDHHEARLTQRFAANAAALGSRFEPRVLPAEAANPFPPPFFSQVVGCPHAVVTAHLVDGAGEPTTVARDEILTFLVDRLTTEVPPREQRGDGSSHRLDQDRT